MVHKTIGSKSSNFFLGDIQKSPAQEIRGLRGLARRKSNDVTELTPMIRAPDTGHGHQRTLWKQSTQNDSAEIL